MASIRLTLDEAQHRRVRLASSLKNRSMRDYCREIAITQATQELQNAGVDLTKLDQDPTPPLFAEIGEPEKQ